MEITEEEIKQSANELKDIAGISNETSGEFLWEERKRRKRKSFPIDVIHNTLYIGQLIPKMVDWVEDKKIIGKKQIERHCLIPDAESRKLVEWNLKAEQDFGIYFDSLPSYLPLRWRLESIKQYLDGKDAKPSPYALLSKISGTYEKYLHIRNRTWYLVHSLWDLGTYLYPIFEAYPFFELRGIAGTSKTKSMVISSYISFNATEIMVNPSEATLFREKDEVRGTSYFDEAEKLWIYNKLTKQYEGDVRTELINASYTKEGKVPRQEKIGNRFITKWYSPYSPIQLASIQGLYGASETRAITRITTKSPDEDMRGEKQPEEDRNLPIWEEIRDECYRFALYNWKDIRKIYLEFENKTQLKKRDLQIWKPILAIAKFIDEKVYEEIVKFAEEISEQKKFDLINETSFDYKVLLALQHCILANPLQQKIYLDMIREAYFKAFGTAEGQDNKYQNRTISNHLDKLGFKEFRKRDKVANYFSVLKKDFNEIIKPICPQLVIVGVENG